MIAELGLFFIILAFFTACLQAVVPLAGVMSGDSALCRTAAPLSVLEFLLCLAAFLVLVRVHAVSDFSVLNVFSNSHSLKPFIYKLTGVWGNHEGSMLLFILILSVYGAVLARMRNIDETLRARTLAVQGGLAAVFTAFLVLTSNPFERIFPVPADGQGLNPLLQDPGLIIHPPLLYLGYVGFSITFSFAVAGLLAGRIDRSWARTVRPWAMTAWVFLTAGIAVGSWWAYYELGWGGFWAWDPVENASLMPWLAGTAFIHCVRVLEQRDTLKVWTVLLAIAAFSLSLTGTFLVRSGLLTSVHAFAVDPDRGIFILAIIAGVIGGSLLLFGLRAPLLQGRKEISLFSREGAILVNNLLLVTACITVFAGTFYPLGFEMLSGKRLSVGAPYFNITVVPVLVAGMAIIPLAIMSGWKRTRVMKLFSRVWPGLLAGLSVMLVVVILSLPGKFTAIPVAGIAAWTGAGILADVWRRASVRAQNVSGIFRNIFRLPLSYHGMICAHLGISVAAFGILGAGVWRAETAVYMNPGDTMEIAGYQVTLGEVTENRVANYMTQTAEFSVSDRGGHGHYSVNAERRYYPVRGVQTTESGILTKIYGDLYITIGVRAGEAGYAVRVRYYPLAVWMWAGALVIVAGGSMIVLSRRKELHPDERDVLSTGRSPVS